MTEARATQARYKVTDLERIFESGRHKSGSADIKVLEFFYDALREERLEDDAVVAYGMHLERGDVKYIGAWVQTMHKIVSRNPDILAKVRLRPNLTYDKMTADSTETSHALKWFMNKIAETMRNELTPESAATNARRGELIQQLDQRS